MCVISVRAKTMCQHLVLLGNPKEALEAAVVSILDITAAKITTVSVARLREVVEATIHVWLKLLGGIVGKSLAKNMQDLLQV